MEFFSQETTLAVHEVLCRRANAYTWTELRGMRMKDALTRMRYTVKQMREENEAIKRGSRKNT